MDKPRNDEDKKAPKNFDHLRDSVDDTKERIKQVDDQIKVVPSDRGPQLDLNPPGTIRSRQFGHQSNWRKSLEGYKAQIKADQWKSIEDEVKDADQKTARTIKDTYREELYPNPYKKMGPTEKATHQKLPRDMEQSQDFMDSKFTVQPEHEKTAEDSQPQSPEKSSSSMSARFSQSLNYNRVTEKTDKAPEKDTGKDKDD